MPKSPEEVVSVLRNTYSSGRTRPIDYRVKQLKLMKQMVEENKDTIIECLAQDLHKSKFESIVMEIDLFLNGIKCILMHIHEWIKPERPSKDLANILDSVYILDEPYGVVLIMGAWNYPIELILEPVAAAIAAGNCVLMKPSEVAPSTSKFLAEYVPKYLDPDAYQVLEGGIAETTELLNQRFDYIFYTGSTHVGRIVHAAANKHLTPTTLELGGK